MKTPIKIHEASRASVVVNLTFLVLAGFTVAGFFLMDTGGTDLGKAFAGVGDSLRKMFITPEITSITVWDSIEKLLMTLGLGFLTTLIGAVFALVLGLLAARNLSSARVSNFIKGFVAFIRAVPTVLWVLIFAVGAGLGSVAAIVGMSFHSMGYLIKAYSESFEEIDEGVIEALKASGANWLQIVFQAVLPSSTGYLLSWTFIRFEINFTTAVAMGAAAGAGGIGYDLFIASGRNYNFHETGYITYLILAVAVVMEIIATRMKARQRLAL